MVWLVKRKLFTVGFSIAFIGFAFMANTLGEVGFNVMIKGSEKTCNKQ